MKRSSFERRLREELHAARPPRSAEAERRAWHVVEAAHAERPVARRRQTGPRVALALAATALLLALVLTPAGAKVSDWIGEVVAPAPTGTGLDSLPARGRLLVEAPGVAWIVGDDGAKRRLGAMRDPTWSPGGLFVAAARGNTLLALEPDGDIRWIRPAPGRVADPRWSPDGFRIAYRTGDALRVAVADNSNTWKLARDVASTPPAWQPGRQAGEQVLAFATDRRILIADVDGRRVLGATPPAAPRELWWSGRRLVAVAKDGIRVYGTRGRLLRRLELPARLRAEGSALDPSGRRLAIAAPHADGRSSQLLLYRLTGSADPERIFAGPGFIDGLSWSMDGRVIVLGLRSADQWVFLRPAGGRLEAVSRIERDFGAPGRAGNGAFPRPAGWCYDDPATSDRPGQPPCTAGAASSFED